MALDTVRKLVKAMLEEIGYLGVASVLNDEDADKALKRLQTFVDELRADRLFAYTVKRRTFALTANQQAHTIGPTGSGADLIVAGDATRPIWIAHAAIIPVGATTELPPLAIIDRTQWLAEPAKAQTSTVPLRVNYEPTFPVGTLNFWPIQTTAPTLVLGIPVPLDAFTTLDTALAFPPGYEALFLYGGARAICRTFRKPLTADLVDDYERARALVVRNNDEGPERIGVDAALTGNPGFYNGYTDEFD